MTELLPEQKICKKCGDEMSRWREEGNCLLCEEIETEDFSTVVGIIEYLDKCCTYWYDEYHDSNNNSHDPEYFNKTEGRIDQLDDVIRILRKYEETKPDDSANLRMIEESAHFKILDDIEKTDD